ncbi:DUF952 domain-containing protein [Lacihabitans sp. LS3-19]|uniref:DUF952 domain-containing protein n=1 Tax=Lacihabitans sp. LS3-19 TaxID=2487335 RepID=UPI0020CDE0D1|nr:DUF952 domain-containing protein [Lacihabitans sp. LS3-19]MCP9767989.1 DUF952 domain-containing protein [Lacihabitans sp. LS3-19]
MIFHVVKKAYWEKFENEAFYYPETFEAEGFMHLSTENQVAGVLERYYVNQKDLILLSINDEILGDKLLYEKATNGEIFPHYYGQLPKDCISDVRQIR